MEGAVAQGCNTLTLQPDLTGGMGSIPDRAPPLERHDEESRTGLSLPYFSDHSTWH